jgi:hypothetical protein
LLIGKVFACDKHFLANEHDKTKAAGGQQLLFLFWLAKMKLFRKKAQQEEMVKEEWKDFNAADFVGKDTRTAPVEVHSAHKGAELPGMSAHREYAYWLCVIHELQYGLHLQAPVLMIRIGPRVLCKQQTILRVLAWGQKFLLS